MARPNASEGAADLDAGDFTTWLGMIELSIRTGAQSDVPCGSCTACCTSGQFVHIAPDEVATIAAIPAPLLFPAPGAPPGHVLLGYDENGRMQAFMRRHGYAEALSEDTWFKASANSSLCLVRTLPPQRRESRQSPWLGVAGWVRRGVARLVSRPVPA